MLAKTSRLFIVTLTTIGWCFVDLPSADAQGLLQRLGNRIRARVNSSFTPPAPVPNRNVAPYGNPNGTPPVANRDARPSDPNDLDANQQQRNQSGNHRDSARLNRIPPITPGTAAPGPIDSRNTIPNRLDPRASLPGAPVPGGQVPGQPTPLGTEPSNLREIPGNSGTADNRSNFPANEFGGSILAPNPTQSPDLNDSLSNRPQPDTNRDREVKSSDSTKTASRATIGIRVLDPRPEMPSVQVVSFNDESQADEAGLQRGDAILGIDGVPTPNIASIAAALSDRLPGEVVQVQIGRRNRVMQVPVQLVSATQNRVRSARPSAASANAPTPLPASDRPELGIDVEEPRGSRGALVVSVTPDTPAAYSGIRVGDRIVAVDRRFVVDPDQLAYTLENRKDPVAPMQVKLIRNDGLVDLVVRFDGRETPLGTNNTTAPSTDEVSNAPISNGTNPKDSESSLLEGLGATLGGWFNKKNSDKNDAVDKDSNLPAGEIQEIPVPGRTAPIVRQNVNTQSPNREDLLAFGDGEPIDQEIFDESGPLETGEGKTSPRDLPPLPAPTKATKDDAEKQVDSLNKKLSEEIRAEIERLKEKLQELESED